ncbi:MAG: hypothetical protein IPH48_11700 [bacterium]|nr:hypothetical protein [bacterium]
MPARDRRRRGFREAVADDVDLLPLMNLFVALIPMLLVSAVFLNITVIDLTRLPRPGPSRPAWNWRCR